MKTWCRDLLFVNGLCFWLTTVDSKHTFNSKKETHMNLSFRNFYRLFTGTIFFCYTMVLWCGLWISYFHNFNPLSSLYQLILIFLHAQQEHKVNSMCGKKKSSVLANFYRREAPITRFCLSRFKTVGRHVFL